MVPFLQFLQFVPAGLLIASGLLEIFVISRRNAEAEPGVLWLLFCTVAAAGVSAATGFVFFFWKGDKAALLQAFWALSLAVAGTAAWFLKRQGRNRSHLLLNEKFRDANPAQAPRRRPGQVLWILGYRGALLGTAAVALAGFFMDAAWLNSRPPAEGTPGFEAGGVSSAEETPVKTQPLIPSMVAAAAASPALVDPTRAEIPSAELSAVAAMATSAAGTPPPPMDAVGKMGSPEDTAPPEAPATPVVAVPAAPSANSRPVSRNSVYFSKVRPILARSCVSCHGPSKQKGDLRLDTPDALRAGANGKPVIVPGNPAKSRLHIVTGLPADDTDKMPPKGTALNGAERALIADWIKAGADLGDGVSIPAGKDGVFVVDAISETLPAPDPKLLESLTAEHVVIRPLSKNGHVIEMDFSHSDRARGDLKLAELAPIALNIYALDFSRTSIRDADLAQLAPMKNLARLLLSRTGVTDAGLAQLKANTSLEQINLYSTAVTDAGLGALSGLKSLKKVYLWQSKATMAGAKTLQDQVPGLVVSMGE